MKLVDTFEQIEDKIHEFEKLMDAVNEAEKDGNRFKAHGAAKDAEKVVDKIGELVYSMTDDDVEEFMKYDAQIERENMISYLKTRAENLPKLIEEYEILSNGEDELAAYRKLREIIQLGSDIANVTERNYD